MNSNDWETLDVTSDNHSGQYCGDLSVMHVQLVCNKTEQGVWDEEREYGGWIATHVYCPYCQEHFRILNPEPYDHF